MPLKRAKQRLGKRASQIHWDRNQISLNLIHLCQFDLWHDSGAAFHFLTSAKIKIRKYVSVAENDCYEKIGYIILGTFYEEERPSKEVQWAWIKGNIQKVIRCRPKVLKQLFKKY
jgi:hypothetical protein